MPSAAYVTQVDEAGGKQSGKRCTPEKGGAGGIVPDLTVDRVAKVEDRLADIGSSFGCGCKADGFSPRNRLSRDANPAGEPKTGERGESGNPADGAEVLDLTSCRLADDRAAQKGTNTTG